MILKIMKLTDNAESWAFKPPRSCRPASERAFSLVELLVVLAIIAAVSGVVTFAVLRTLDGQEEKQCLANMLLIEAAKDEHSRDHVGTAAALNADEFRRYFRFGVPRCPHNPNVDYENWSDLNASVICPVHPQNTAKLNPR
jgi:prepilin-type N-terminal cleavage/methylation domain-containing protein